MTLPLDQAVDRVVRDVHRSWPHLSAVEALTHAYDTVAPDQVNPDEPLPLDDDVERVAVEEWNLGNQAWRLVLAALHRRPTRAQLEELVVLLSSEDVVRLSTLQEYRITVLRRERGL